MRPSDGEDRRLDAAVRRGRDADRALAGELGRPAPAARAAGPHYLRRLAERPAVEPAREAELVRGAQCGDPAARAALIDALMPLIASVAGTYRGSAGIERLELLQEGVVGVLRALERYDADRNVPFWAYAAWWVRQAMQQLVAELTGPAVLSDRALRHLANLKDAHRDALRVTGREPTRDELAERTGLSGEQVDDLLAAGSPARSLDEPRDGVDGAVGTFGELIADPLAEDAYERVLEAIETEELLALLSGLSDRERDVLRSRYGLDGDEQTLGEVGRRLGLSAERVRQIERRALAKLAAGAG